MFVCTCVCRMSVVSNILDKENHPKFRTVKLTEKNPKTLN